VFYFQYVKDREKSTPQPHYREKQILCSYSGNRTLSFILEPSVTAACLKVPSFYQVIIISIILFERMTFFVFLHFKNLILYTS
jgi:hypothetical protein